MPLPADTPLLCLTVFGDGLNNPSTDRRRFSLRGCSNPVDADPQKQNDTAEPPRPINPFTGKPIEFEPPTTNVGNHDAHSGTRVGSKPSVLPHTPLFYTGAAVGVAPGIVGSTPTQLKTQNLKSIRDNVNSLLQGASTAEAHKLQRILDDLNAEISEEHPFNISNGRMTDASSHLAPMQDGDTAISTTKAYLRHTRTFQSSNTPGETVWYESSGSAPLAQPDAAICPNTGDLYLHKDHTTGNLQLWTSAIEGQWKSVAIEYVPKYLPDRIVMGASHPKFNDRLLKLRTNGEPSWVTRQTLATLKSRKKGGITQG